MPKCPKCNKEIDHLHDYVKGWKYYQYFAKGDYDDEGFIPDDFADEEYDCPECGETLFTQEEDADKFLLNEKPKDKCDN